MSSKATTDLLLDIGQCAQSARVDLKAALNRPTSIAASPSARGAATWFGKAHAAVQQSAGCIVASQNDQAGIPAHKVPGLKVVHGLDLFRASTCAG